MPVLIRQATIDDADALTFVQVESWKTTYAGIVPDSFLARLSDVITSVKWRERLQAEELHTLVSENETGVVGFVSGGKLREPVGDYDGELHAIYLLREVQRQGIGRMLTQSLAHTLHARGLQSMLVWVLEENPAVDFYQRLGAVTVTRKSIEIGGASLMELALGWPTLHSLLADMEPMRPTGA
jgi:ribosomal protein S18 acetylase RimI-like enzyme